MQSIPSRRISSRTRPQRRSRSSIENVGSCQSVNTGSRWAVTDAAMTLLHSDGNRNARTDDAGGQRPLPTQPGEAKGQKSIGLWLRLLAAVGGHAKAVV